MSQELTKVCSQCGRKFAAKYKFCLTDGGPLEVLGDSVGRSNNTVTALSCPKCGATAKANWKFCAKCRSALTAENSPPTRQKSGAGEAVIARSPQRQAEADPPHDNGNSAHHARQSHNPPPDVVENDGGPPPAPTKADTPPPTRVPQQLRDDDDDSAGGGERGLADTVIGEDPPALPQAVKGESSDVGAATPADAGAPAGEEAESLTALQTDVASGDGHLKGQAARRGDAIDDADRAPHIDGHERSMRTALPAGKKLSVRTVSMIAALCAVIALTAVFYLSTRGTNEVGTSAKNVPAASPAPNSSPANVARAATATADMVYVSGGTFRMGRDDGDQYERPAHTVSVRPFYIDKYEVTCEQYAKFLDATGQPPPSTWRGGKYAAGDARKPVTGVNWVEANAYAQWAGKRLPTEEEWEFAARGTDGRRYPWGDDWRPDVVNADRPERLLEEIGSRTGNGSPFGAYDMVGNAWEWTASTLAAYPGGALPPQSAGVQKVLRGGSWQSKRDQATTTYRFGWPAQGGKDYSNTSFRCARGVEQ